MKRIKPVIECSGCAAWNSTGFYCRDGKNKNSKGTCVDVRPKEIGSCGECFYLGEELKSFIVEKGEESLYLCAGDRRCRASETTRMIVEGELSTSITHRVIRLCDQGGPFWHPAEIKSE